MIRHAWASYYRFARGYDELCPLGRSGRNWTAGPGVLFTPTDSMDTLHIAGLHAEYAQAKALVLTGLDFAAVHSPLNAFETTIRSLGGLLAAYDLDGDPRLLAKARDLADRMIAMFRTDSGIPHNEVRLDLGVAFAGSVSLATAGTHQLEYQYLSDVTGDPKYAAVVGRRDKVGVAGENDSYYEYLLKMWLSTREPRYRRWYDESILAIEEHILVKKRNGEVAYLPDKVWGRSESTFHHLIWINVACVYVIGEQSCFAGGMFALGAVTRSDQHSHRLFAIGANITRTCFEAYAVSSTKLGGETVYVSDQGDLSVHSVDYLLRPEVVESIFILWRLTHNPMYRDWGWQIVQALESQCRNTDAGYHAIDSNGAPSDRQESFFLAETLKYLYLLFSDDATVPLDRFVFNTEAHPLSIRGHGRRADATKWVPIPDAAGLKEALPW
nr:hypothetical protein HK105_000924 [Polyrhizophydium stewartii]